VTKPPRPVLLLDVDGVLNVPRTGCEAVRLADGPYAWSFNPVEPALPFLRWAWTHFAVHWLTSWRNAANVIAGWAGLPKITALDADAGVSGDWKLEAVKRRFARRRCSVVWIEDGISPAALAWIGARPNFRYVETDPFKGLTTEHIRAAAEFAHVPEMGLGR